MGGLAIGEGQETTFAMLDATVPVLPADRPRYLMGVGKPEDLVGAVMRGIDMFDCVMPTRSGRTGQAFTRRGEVNLRNARHVDDRAARRGLPLRRVPHYSAGLSPSSDGASEILGSMLLTEHNLRYYQDLMAGLRAAISEGALEEIMPARSRACAPKATFRRSERPMSDDRKPMPLGLKAALPASPADAVLDASPTRIPARYLVRFTCPEFTALCPITGQPDFAHLVIDYVPKAASSRASR